LGGECCWDDNWELVVGDFISEQHAASFDLQTLLCRQHCMRKACHGMLELLASVVPAAAAAAMTAPTILHTCCPALC
jgi:hypothetical protein